MSLLKLQIIGNVGADAVVNNVNGKQVINFNVCHTERFKDNNGVENNRSTWINCSFWTERTAVAQYIKKGNQIYVEGQPTTDTYTKEGKTFAQLKLRVTNIQLLSSNQNNQQQTSQKNNTSSGNAAFDKTMDDKDDLPF